ncbi:MAG: hypothetical protein H0T89_35075 [Deltaproteobacteria bacterium]|nr:hypothetical protein [Deltaproteobacteria bacterium]MDQ3296133.1 energy transducer TonB [Myxococcota bacterium]
MSPRTASLLVVVLAAAPAAADDDADKYKAMDAARLAIVDALDKRDAAAFEPYVGDSLETSGLWFSTASCRTRFSTARVKIGKDLRALVDCFAPLGVKQSGLLVHYGPGVTMSVKLDVTDGKAKLTKLSAFAGDPAAPEIFGKIFESHRTAGNPIVPLDDAARTELADFPRGVVAFKACVDKAGRVNRHTLVELDKRTALAKAIGKAVRTWKFKPFTIRGKPLAVCAVAFVRASDHQKP